MFSNENRTISKARENLREFTLNNAIKKDFMVYLISLCYRKYDNTKTAEILDQIKNWVKYATKGITIGIDDIVVPKAKEETLQKRTNR